MFIAVPNSVIKFLYPTMTNFWTSMRREFDPHAKLCMNILGEKKCNRYVKYTLQSHVLFFQTSNRWMNYSGKSKYLLHKYYAEGGSSISSKKIYTEKGGWNGKRQWRWMWCVIIIQSLICKTNYYYHYYSAHSTHTHTHIHLLW